MNIETLPIIQFSFYHAVVADFHWIIVCIIVSFTEMEVISYGFNFQHWLQTSRVAKDENFIKVMFNFNAVKLLCLFLFHLFPLKLMTFFWTCTIFDSLLFI